MKQVWFAPVKNDAEEELIQQKVVQLYNRAVDSFAFDNSQYISEEEIIALKISFGEKNNTGHIKPVYLEKLIDSLQKAGGRPFFTDANTLYKGQRSDSVAHLLQAAEHGFSIANTGIPVIIADGLLSKNHTGVEISGSHFSEVKIATDIVHSDLLIALSHVTGHLGSCLGATIKNIGMGCASRSGKQSQHADFKPEVAAAECTACGQCVQWCPVEAIEIVEGVARIDYDTCYGCAECMATCQFGAISTSWSGSSRELQEKMAEYTLGAIKGKEEKTLYFNFLIHVTKDCDCMGRAQQKIIDDIGIMVSRDPVAVDQAAIDLLNEVSGKDFLKKTWEESNLDYRHQLQHAEKIGLGSREYKLVEV